MPTSSLIETYLCAVDACAQSIHPTYIYGTPHLQSFSSCSQFYSARSYSYVLLQLSLKLTASKLPTGVIGVDTVSPTYEYAYIMRVYALVLLLCLFSYPGLAMGGPPPRALTSLKSVPFSSLLYMAGSPLCCSTGRLCLQF